MMLKDIRREFLTGPRNLDEIVGKLGIIVKRNDGRRRASAIGLEQCRCVRREDDTE